MQSTAETTNFAAKLNNVSKSTFRISAIQESSSIFLIFGFANLRKNSNFKKFMTTKLYAMLIVQNS
jgi:hypothetical protein